MKPRIKAREIPGRLTTGAYILHAGWEKLRADSDRAASVHAFTERAFPIVKRLSPETFIRCLAVGEVLTAAALLTPMVPRAVAGSLLTGFSGGLMALYLRTPELRRPGSIWPSTSGTGVSKDVWMLGIGLGLLADALTDRNSN